MKAPALILIFLLGATRAVAQSPEPPASAVETAESAEPAKPAEPAELSLISTDVREVLRSDEPSGYLNVRLDRTSLAGDAVTEDRESVSGQLDLVHSMRGWTFLSGAAAVDRRAPVWRRADTRLVRDDEDRLIRWTVGDFTVGTRGFQAAEALGGLSFRRELSIRPERTAVRLGDDEIFLKRDSTVEVLVDGAAFARLNLSAGRFRLRELPVLTGLSRVTLKIRDDLGQTETIEIDLLSDADVLEAGEHEFGYHIGFPWRENGADRAYDTSGAYSSFYHRYGWSDRTSVGMNLQNYFYRIMGGIEVSRLGSWGVATADVAGSDVIGVRGFSARLRWHGLDRFEGIAPGWRAAAEIRKQTDTFFAVDPSALIPLPFEDAAEIQLSKLFGRGWVAGFGERLERGFGEGQDRRIDRASLSIPLTPSARLEFGYRRTDAATDTEDGLIVLHWSDVPGRFSASASHLTVAGVKSGGFTVARNDDGAGDDWRAAATVRQTDSENSAANVEAARLFPRGELRVDHRSARVAGSRSDETSIGASTAVAWAGGRAAWSAPVDDAFALSRGRAVPLTSHATADVDDGAGIRRVRPGYRQGVLVEPGERIAVRGQLLRADGSPLALVSGAVLDAEKRPVDDAFFTDREGRFLIENAAPGESSIVLDGSGRTFRFSVPRGSAADVDLGVVTAGEEEAP